MKDEVLENNIVTYHNQGWSMRRLATEFGISRQRVKRILELNVEKRENGDKTPAKSQKRTSLLDDYKEYIGDLLEKFQKPAITNQRIFELLQEKGYSGGITTLRDYLAQKRTNCLCRNRARTASLT